jgi:molybdenum cofactor cytidylyltransferase
MITCILLSAGLSERFGSPKALAKISEKPIIQDVQNALLQSSCDKIIVVLGAHAQQIQPSIFIHSRIRVVYNKDYFFGQTSSIQAGWREADLESRGIMFLPVDCPLVQSSSIDKIIDHFKINDPDILIPTYHTKKGHPPIINQRLKSKVLALPKELGLNSLFADYQPQAIEIEDAGIIKSFNTPEEFEKLRQ